MSQFIPFVKFVILVLAKTQLGSQTHGQKKRTATDGNGWKWINPCKTSENEKENKL